MSVLAPGELNEELLDEAIDRRDLNTVHDIAEQVSDSALVSFLGRSSSADQAVLFRMLGKERALQVFEDMTPGAQAQLVANLQAGEVTHIFDEMDPDDRVSLIEELPAKVATRLMRGLDGEERQLTAVVLGYPQGSVGRRMSPEVIPLRESITVKEALDLINSNLYRYETIYTLPVVNDTRQVTGVVGLRDLLAAEPDQLVGEIAVRADLCWATESDEAAARRCADDKRLALPVVDSEKRLVGILTVDDALSILEEEESEDHARKAGAEPLRSPYLSTPIRNIVGSRLVWLLVLAIGATLTVHVLESFESTLSQMVVLSVFIPLLIGTGGNTGNQAASTVIRALALGDVRPRDVFRVLIREMSVGASLGLVLGGIAFALGSLLYSPQIGAVVGLTLLSVCTLAATVGGVMPLIAKKLKADPAVFSNPFISTFIDATGLILYFLIAKTILGL